MGNLIEGISGERQENFLKKEISLPEEKERDFTVRQHKMAYAIGLWIIGAGIVFLVLELVFHLSAIPLWIYAIILAICLLGIMVCLEAKNRQLAICKNHLYYSSLFGSVRHFRLEDIGSVKVAFNPPVGRDELKIYAREGNQLCRLECSMRNVDKLIRCFYDNGIAVAMEKDTRQDLRDLVLQTAIDEGKLQSCSQKVYGQAKLLMEGWMERNKKLGAELSYGLAEYYGSRIDIEAQMQPEESRIKERGGGLPEDYLCLLEVYVKKDGSFVRDRKKQLLAMDFPVFYKRKAKTKEGEIRLYYNESWKSDLTNGLQSLEKYLPGHRFYLEQMELEHELKKEVSK